MQAYETWIDIECPVGGERKIACSLFAQLIVEHPFVTEESVTFWPLDDQATYFHVLNSVAEQKVHYVSTVVESIDRHFRATANGVASSFSLRFSTVRAKSEQDAFVAITLLVNQHGFELDPYGPKLLRFAATD